MSEDCFSCGWARYYGKVIDTPYARLWGVCDAPVPAALRVEEFYQIEADKPFTDCEAWKPRAAPSEE